MSIPNDQLIAGLEGLPVPMRDFLQEVPKLWTPDEVEPVTFYAFAADGGLTVIAFDPPEGNDDAKLDFVANAVIGCVKRDGPIGLIGVSEGFVWQTDPTSPASVEASERFRSARQSMPGKQEVLMAWVETADRDYHVTWPIYSGPPRRVGHIRIQDGLMGGRFCRLLQKQHATEILVKASTAKPKVPISPQPLEALQARYAAAIAELLPVAVYSDDGAKHVFDFEDGLRLIISVHAFEPPQMVVMAVNHGRPIPAHQYEPLVFDRLSKLSGRQWLSSEVINRTETQLRMGMLALSFPGPPSAARVP